MKYFIRLSYNGAPFRGWQRQKNANSVQEELEKAFSVLLKKDVEIVGAGRTDSYVNAVNYIAHTNVNSIIPPKGVSKRDFIYKINAILPEEIIIHNIFKVDEDSHARFDAVRRTYQYFIRLNNSPFNSSFSYLIKKGKLDFEAMNNGAKYFLGEHDFSSLEKVGSDNKNSICTVFEAYWKKCRVTPPFENEKNDCYVYTVSANRFLRNMVRAMVGTLLVVGQGKENPEWVNDVIKSKSRCSAGMSVPGNALFLTKIEYPYKIY